MVAKKEEAKKDVFKPAREDYLYYKKRGFSYETVCSRHFYRHSI